MVYVSIRRLRRGYYEMQLTELYDGETPLPKDGHQITEAFARQLERDIRIDPANTYGRTAAGSIKGEVVI